MEKTNLSFQLNVPKFLKNSEEHKNIKEILKKAGISFEEVCLDKESKIFLLTPNEGRMTGFDVIEAWIPNRKPIKETQS